jgi:3-dehydrocarnitine:acetyl-CoA trimethylamine transferase
MADKTIITCAVTGNITRPEQHPDLPVTPEQIADAAIDAAKAGAAIAHIHVRDPRTGAPSMALEHYREVVERIRASDTDLIINLTTGPGGRFMPSDDDPRVAAPGSTLVRPERRVEHVVALRPEICSLDLNTMWFGNAVVINTPRNVTIMAGAIREAGVKPELEVFDSGDIQLAHQLLESGVLPRPPLFQVVLGIRNGFPATPDTLLYAKSLLPADAQWAAMGTGRMEFPIVAQACLLGGHVRVGLEDNLYLSKGLLAPSNAALVERAVTIVELLGRSVASPAEARALLGLKPPSASAWAPRRLGAAKRSAGARAPSRDTG